MKIIYKKITKHKKNIYIFAFNVGFIIRRRLRLWFGQLIQCTSAQREEPRNIKATRDKEQFSWLNAYCVRKFSNNRVFSLRLSFSPYSSQPYSSSSSSACAIVPPITDAKCNFAVVFSLSLCNVVASTYTPLSLSRSPLTRANGFDVTTKDTLCIYICTGIYRYFKWKFSWNSRVLFFFKESL